MQKPPPVTLENCRPCGLLRQLLAILYDGLVVIALLMLAAAAVLPLGTGRVALHDPAYTLYLLVVWFAYLGFCWTHGGQTVGMRAWKIRLHSTQAQPITWVRSLVRFAVSLLSAALFGLGFIWCLWQKQHLSWHGMASATQLCLDTPVDRHVAGSNAAPQEKNHRDGQKRGR